MPGLGFRLWHLSDQVGALSLCLQLPKADILIRRALVCSSFSVR